MKKNQLYNYPKTGAKILMVALAFSITFTVKLHAQFSLSFSTTPATCFGLPTGSASVSAIGGIPPLTYQWSNGAITSAISGVLAGTYQVTVTASNGAVAGSVTITQPTQVLANIVGDTCQFPAILTATGSGGAGNYTYAWDGGTMGQTLVVNAPGMYCVTVVDETWCGIVECIKISAPPVTVAVQATSMLCATGNTGQIQAIPGGGKSPYTFLWNNGQTTQTAVNLGVGIYTVTVTDARGCTASAVGQVTAPPPVVATITGNNPTCIGFTNGNLVGAATGGTPPYEFFWNNGVNGPNNPNLGPGTYSLTVRDANNCITTQAATLINLSNLTVGSVGSAPTCTGFTNGTATVSPQNGVVPYQYNWSNGGITQTITGLSPGSYSVTVTDALGCQATSTALVGTPPAFTLSMTSTNSTSCDSDNGTATVSVTQGIPPFSYSWSNGVTGTPSITDLAPGLYTVTVTNGANCVATASVTITEPPALGASVAATPLVCIGQSNGAAAAVVAGGTAPFTFVWTNGSSNQIITGLPPGQYTVSVTDAVGCRATATGIIQPAPLPSVGINATLTVCGAGNTGNATAFATGGSAPYSFLWSTGASGPSVSGLAEGTYTVTATDLNQCMGTASVNINVIDDLAVNVTPQSVLCFGGSTGRATASASGGSSPYSYLWSTGTTGPQLLNRPAGPVSVTVTDANGCTVSGSAIIAEPPQLNVNIITSAAQLCPGEAEGTLIADVTGGTPNFSYLWSTGATTASIIDIGAGTYSVTVTDGNGCMAADTLTITEFQEMDLFIEGEDVVCGEAFSGEAEVVVIGGTGPFSYLWSNGADSDAIGGLGTGTYTVTVIDANGCSSTAEFDITVVSDFELTAVARDVLCFGDDTGGALATATGGTPPYNFTWSNGSNTAEATNLTAGVYTVTVTEQTGCIIIAEVTVNEPPLLELSASTTDVNCFGGSDGRAIAQPTGGSEPYQYAWSNGLTDAAVQGLAAGTYFLTVSDINLCTVIDTLIVRQPPALIVNVSTVNPLCAGDLTGTASAAVAGGVPPYNYFWNTGGLNPVITQLSAGTYSVTIEDDNGCEASRSALIMEPPAIEINLLVTDIICSNSNIGSVSAVVTGGSGAYSYLWSTGANTSFIENLPSGEYRVTVTDGNNCRQTAIDTVQQSVELSIGANVRNVSCFGLADGSITLDVMGGIGPYTFTWNNGASSSTLSNLSPGIYSVTVSDQNGCSGSFSAEIRQPTPLVVTVSPTPILCNGQTTGAVSAVVLGGTAPYSYLWSNGSTSQGITGLGPGLYNLTVRDANNCVGSGSAQVTQPPALTVTITQQLNTCAGSSNAVLSASATGGTGSYSFQWSNGVGGSVASNLSGGTYSVTVTDNNNCRANTSFIVTPAPVPVCSITVNQYVLAGNDGSLSVQVTGGTSPYAFNWSNGALGSTIFGLAPGSYSVTVTDFNGCRSICNFQMPAPACVGDFVWLDLNFNGMQDPGEPGIPDVTVILSGATLTAPYSDTMVTTSTGFFKFFVQPGEYKLTFILPPGVDVSPSQTHAGSDENLDSDVNPLTFMTDFFTIGPGMNDFSWDAGFTPPCINITNPGTIGVGYQFLCGPGNIPATINSLTLPSGGTDATPIEYIWMRSQVNGPFDNGFWEMIPGTNSPSYNPGPVYQTTYFARCARRLDCGPFLESNIVLIEVGNVSVANINGPSIVCLGDSATFLASGFGPGAVIQWNFSAGVSPATATGPSATVTFSSFGLFTATLSVTQNGCTASNVKQITVTNSPIYCGDGIVLDGEPTDLHQVALEWKMPLNEPRHRYFLERSFDGNQFDVIAEFTDPTMLLNNEQVFRHLDEHPKMGRNHYRVRYLSTFGNSMSYSNEVEIVMRDENDLVLFFPNPVHERAVLELFESFNGDVTLDIVTSNGIRLQQIRIPRDTPRIELDFSRWPAGVYFMRLRYGDIELKRLKVVKI